MSLSLFWCSCFIFLNRDSWEAIAVLEVFPSLNLTELAKCLLQCQNCGITSQKKSLSQYYIIFEMDMECSRYAELFLPALFGTSQRSCERSGVLCPSTSAEITWPLFPVCVKHLHSAEALLTSCLLCVMMLPGMTSTCLYQICATCWVLSVPNGDLGFRGNTTFLCTLF